MRCLAATQGKVCTRDYKITSNAVNMYVIMYSKCYHDPITDLSSLNDS